MQPPGDHPDYAGRDQAGRFRKGVSGNPAGMPKGVRHRASQAAEKIFADDLKGIAEVVTREAKAGAPWACRLVVASFLPPPRTRAVQFALPPIRSASDIPLALTQVLGLIADGTLTPQEGSEVASLVDCLRASFEVDQLTARVEALQAQVALMAPAVH
jgi:hypothetical protein